MEEWRCEFYGGGGERGLDLNKWRGIFDVVIYMSKFIKVGYIRYK